MSNSESYPRFERSQPWTSIAQSVLLPPYSAAAPEGQLGSTFSGTGGLEWDDLVRNVRQLALAEGGGESSMTQYAASSLSGEAVAWYSTLDEATRSDWTLFLLALVRRFGSPSHVERPRIE